MNAYGRWLVVIALLATGGCQRDPNVVKLRYLESGNRYFDNGRIREASIMYRRAVQVDPKFGEPYYRNALVMLKTGQIPEAASALRRAVELLPESDRRRDARIRLGQLLVALLDSGWDAHGADEAGQLAQDLLARDANSFEGLLLSGQVLLLRSRWLSQMQPTEAEAELDRAMAALEKANARRPRQSDVLVPMASALESRQRAAEAIAMLENHTAGADAAPRAFTELARMYIRQRQPDAAERVLRSAIARFPDQFDFRLALIRMQAWFRKPENFRETVAAVVAEHRKFPQVFEAAQPLYLLLGLEDEALALCDRASGLNPDQRVRYQLMKVDTLARLGRREQARKLNQSVLAADPQRREALIREASFELDSGNPEAAQTLLERIVVADPQNPLAQYQMARVLVRASRFGLARQRLVDAVRLAPDFIEARLDLARLDLETGDYMRALSSAEEVLNRDPSNQDAALARIAAIRLLGKLDGAESAIAALPVRSAAALYELCLLRDAQKRAPEAEQACRDSSIADPRDLRGLTHLVESRLSKDDAKGALAIVEAARKTIPPGYELLTLLADTAVKAGAYDTAVAGYLELLPLTEHDAARKSGVLFRLGELQRRTGNLQTAIGNLRTAYKLDPQNPLVLQNLAVALDMAGERGEAMRLYEQSLRLNDRNPVVLNNLAFHLAESGGDLDRALTYAQRALQASPGNPEYLDTIGWIY